jgi:hypothetical protein
MTKIILWISDSLFWLGFKLETVAIGRRALKAEKIALNEPGTERANEALAFMRQRFSEMPEGSARYTLSQMIRQAEKMQKGNPS